MDVMVALTVIDNKTLRFIENALALKVFVVQSNTNDQHVSLFVCCVCMYF